jgi:signal transduction histidine kinase
MLEETIIEQWLTQSSDVALQKLLNHEPLTFEDNIVFALVGQREEMKRMEKKIDGLDKKIDEVRDELKHEITDVKIALRDLRVEMNEYRRMSDDLRKSMVDQTRWTVALVALILTLAKVVDFLK